MFKLYTTLMKGLAKCIFPKPEFSYEEPLPEGETAIFTANHSAAIGPAITALYYPQPIRPWSIAQVLDKKTAAGFIYYDVFAGAVRKCTFFWRCLSHVVAWLLRPLLLEAGCIPVYHDKRMVNTMNESVQTLIDGTNLVIFPECPEKFSPHINDFYAGFVKVAELYYKKTGKRLKIYPSYIAKPLRKVVVGKPVEFDPEQYETIGTAYRKQVAETLRNRTAKLGASLPEHKITPFLTKEWYAAYGHYWTENRMLDYWNLSEHELKAVAKKHKKSKKSKADK